MFLLTPCFFKKSGELSAFIKTTECYVHEVDRSLSSETRKPLKKYKGSEIVKGKEGHPVDFFECLDKNTAVVRRYRYVLNSCTY